MPVCLPASDEHRTQHLGRLARGVARVGDREGEHEVAEVDRVRIAPQALRFLAHEVGSLAKGLIGHSLHVLERDLAALARVWNEVHVVRVFGRDAEQTLAAPADDDGRTGLLYGLRPEDRVIEFVKFSGEGRPLVRPQRNDTRQRLVEHA